MMLTPHMWMLLLSLLILLLCFCMVYSQKCSWMDQPLFGGESFAYSQESAEKLCRTQAAMVAAAPYIGINEEAAYKNCMDSWTPDMNMPSAYLTSADWVPQ